MILTGKGSNWKAMSRESETGPIRLQVYLARCGIASRRKCEDFISEGRVRVNGETVTQPGTKVSSADKILFDGAAVEPEQRKLYIALHKPPRFLCSQHDSEGRKLAADLLKPYFHERLYNVGRLDYLSEGLIFFSNDGIFTAAVSHPSSEIEKEYHVELFSPISSEILNSFTQGIIIDDVRYRIRTYAFLDARTVSITLIEGKNREIRRLMSVADVRVRRLTRVRIGPVPLGHLKAGEYRLLKDKEVNWFLKRKKR